MEHLQAAGFWRRAAASLIDGIIMMIPYSIVIFTVEGSYSAMSSLPMLQYGGMAAGIAYYTLFIASRWQATPGKRLMGVFVVRAEDAGRLSGQRAAARYCVLMLPTLLMVLLTPLMPIADIAPEDNARLVSIQQKIITQQPVTPEEQAFVERQGQIYAELNATGAMAGLQILNIFGFLYLVVNAIMIGVTSRKTGIHDKACKTFAVKGRPEAPVLA